ncbi:MAG: Gfo/Idh/MocA family oxidoreductase [Hyphomonas sp.]|nr:Gfo/Idh/MocA family oxidoreductase [Hyphomonas sp.]
MDALRWGMIGGGKGSQIGALHRYAAALDGKYQLVAGAFDHREQQSIEFGESLGLGSDRAYATWQTFLEAESSRPDPVQLVTVATPNNSHFEITRAFLEAGFHVLCEKPLTMTVEEAETLASISSATQRLCAVNYGYSGYPLVREMKALIEQGKIGAVRLVVCNFAHGHHAGIENESNPRVRWRYNPKIAGVSGQFVDCGIHALHLACFVTGLEVASLSADLVSLVPDRELEDDAMVNVRFASNAIGRIWTSSVAIGRQQGLEIQVFGSEGGVQWRQEQPNQLLLTRQGQRTSIVERGDPHISSSSARSNRITVGHSEGIIEAFANIYVGIAEVIAQGIGADREALSRLHLPTVWDGLESMRAVSAAVHSSQSGGAWIEV